MLLAYLSAAGAVVLLAPAAVLFHRWLRQHALARRLRPSTSQAIQLQQFLPIGGIEQWISIRGEDRANPVLLLVHGGPGASNRIFSAQMRAWEKHFTIVQWDHRGSGKTLGRTGKHGSAPVTLERLTSDGIEIAETVSSLLPACPIVLLGHSLGSAFALRMLKRRPRLFSAYVGTDQNVGMHRDREQEHRSTLARLQSLGLHKGVAALQRIGPDPSGWSAGDYLANAQWTMKSDPASSRRIHALLKQSVWYAPGYTLIDIRNFVVGMRFSLHQLLPDILGFDASSECSHVSVPFFIFQGEHDVLTPPHLAQAYLNEVTAPVKEMALIRNAGHFAAFLEPDQFLAHLLHRVRPLLVRAEIAPATVTP